MNHPLLEDIENSFLTPKGYCRCGCGEPTEATYVYGHNTRIRWPEREFWFWGKVFFSPDGCWIWIGGGTGTRGDYGKFIHDRQQIFCHRYAYESCREPIPQGMTLDHLCKVPRCVNPWHLEVVTYAVNTQRSSHARFSPDDIIEIRKSIESARELAIRYGCTKPAIYDIRTRKTWTNL